MRVKTIFDLIAFLLSVHSYESINSQLRLQRVIQDHVQRQTLLFTISPSSQFQECIYATIFFSGAALFICIAGVFFA